MDTQFQFNTQLLKRTLYLMLAALVFTVGLPLAHSGHAAADQVSTRSIQMSDSSAHTGAITSGVGSGVGVKYKVTFTPVHQAASMVIDFCQEDPILADTCTRPVGMTAATGITNVSGTVGNAGWTLTAAAGQAKLADGGTSTDDMQAATPQVFELTGITNPTGVGTFYARMYTYTDTSWGSNSYTGPTTLGTFSDYGGVAMSTTQVITITARVQEQLTFCVTKANPVTDWTTNYDCSDPAVANPANAPALILGHGTPTAILDANNVDTGTIYSQLSTNATHGAVINIRNSNTSCGGLSADSGTTCAIPPINGGSGAGASAMTAGTAAFGLFASDSSHGHQGATVVGIGSVTGAPAYHDQTPSSTHVDPSTPANLWYGMDNQTAGNSVTSTYGSTVASTTAPTYREENTYVFAATSALTTPAGIYTANLSMTCTGTF